MLYAVARPSRETVSEGKDAVASIGAVKHHLGPGCIVFRILKALAAISHQAAEHGFANTVVEKRAVSHEILLYGVVHGVGYACRRLLPAHRKGVSRVKEGGVRIEERIEITDFVVGLGTGDDAAAVVLASGRCEGQDVHDRKGGLGLHLVRNQVPRISVIASACRNCL